MAEAFHAPARAVVERNRPVLERVGRRYRLGVVSNFTGNLAPCLDELGLTRLFTAVNNLVRRSEEHTSELQSLAYLVCRLLLEKKKARPHCSNKRGSLPPRTSGGVTLC